MPQFSNRKHKIISAKNIYQHISLTLGLKLQQDEQQHEQYKSTQLHIYSTGLIKTKLY